MPDDESEYEPSPGMGRIILSTDADEEGIFRLRELERGRGFFGLDFAGDGDYSYWWRHERVDRIERDGKMSMRSLHEDGRVIIDLFAEEHDDRLYAVTMVIAEDGSTDFVWTPSNPHTG